MGTKLACHPSKLASLGRPLKETWNTPSMLLLVAPRYHFHRYSEQVVGRYRTGLAVVFAPADVPGTASLESALRTARKTSLQTSWSCLYGSTWHAHRTWGHRAWLYSPRGNHPCLYSEYLLIICRRVDQTRQGVETFRFFLPYFSRRRRTQRCNSRLVLIGASQQTFRWFQASAVFVKLSAMRISTGN